MIAVVVVAQFVMVAVVVVAVIVIGIQSSREQARVKKFEASLAWHLPPDVQAVMEPRQIGFLTSGFIVVFVLALILAGLTVNGKASAILFVGFWLVLAVAFAAWTTSC